jgi:hypothetical protein
LAFGISRTSGTTDYPTPLGREEVLSEPVYMPSVVNVLAQALPRCLPSVQKVLALTKVLQLGAEALARGIDEDERSSKKSVPTR